MNNFKKLGIPAVMAESLIKMNFINPTPIQEKAIPVALQGRDILGSAQTGTGKTAAFAIPMITHLMQNEKSMALVLLPTRELAAQVLEASNKMLGRDSGIKSALLIGGDSIQKQILQLKKNPRMIVGTPGRINDHLKRKSLSLGVTHFLVLDETDRMLDMGFGAQLNEIAKYLPKERQTLMFSATLPKNIVSLSNKYLNNPVRIAVGGDNEVATNVKQENIRTSDQNKYEELKYQIDNHTGSILLFVKTKHGADRLAVKLSKEGMSADAIHGDLKQKRRERVISDFRKQNFRILVATDIAARGLDISHIENVINYDLPQCPEDYIHRIGRTGRADATGLAINILTPKDNEKWREIQKLLKGKNKEAGVFENERSDTHKKVNRSESPNQEKKNEEGNAPKSGKPFHRGQRFKGRGKFNKNRSPFNQSGGRPSRFSKRRGR